MPSRWAPGGNSEDWRHADHPIGLDPAGVDVTLVLVVDPDEGVIVSLEPPLHDPRPIGSSVSWKIGRSARPVGGSGRCCHVLPAVESRVGVAPSRVLDLTTRASRDDPLSRWYEPSAFDVLAAGRHGPEGGWSFRYERSKRLALRDDGSGRLAPMQRIADDWPTSLTALLRADG